MSFIYLEASPGMMWRERRETKLSLFSFENFGFAKVRELVTSRDLLEPRIGWFTYELGGPDWTEKGPR